MTDAISRRAAIDVRQELANQETAGDFISDIGFGLTMAIGRLISAPALDVAPVVHAKWVTQGIEVYCTNCMMPQDCGTNFCPHCGARMDGEAE